MTITHAHINRDGELIGTSCNNGNAAIVGRRFILIARKGKKKPAKAEFQNRVDAAFFTFFYNECRKKTQKRE
jgi:hypothetical protein